MLSVRRAPIRSYGPPHNALCAMRMRQRIRLLNSGEKVSVQSMFYRPGCADLNAGTGFAGGGLAETSKTGTAFQG